MPASHVRPAAEGFFRPQKQPPASTLPSFAPAAARGQGGAAPAPEYVRALRLSRAYSEGEVEECMREVAARVGGAVRGGGEHDLEAAALHFVRAFQEGRLGRLTLDWVPVVP